MKSIRFYKYILLIFLAYTYGDALKPSNSRKLDKVSIVSKNTKRTYYHLDKNGSIEFKNLAKILDKNKRYTIKIISRTKIAKNSNSNKSFGFILHSITNNDTITQELKYKKKVSETKLPDKKGFSFTDAGFWMEEIINIKATKFIIEHLKGSPELEIRVIYDEIKPLERTNVVYPVNIESPITVHYFENDGNRKSKHWFGLGGKNDFQFKIKGPAVIRVRSRSSVNENGLSEYHFSLKENGRMMSVHKYNANISEKDAHYKLSDKKHQLTKFKSFLYNVPPGLNYYTLEQTDLFDTDILLKVELYKNDK